MSLIDQLTRAKNKLGFAFLVLTVPFFLSACGGVSDPVNPATVNVSSPAQPPGAAADTVAPVITITSPTTGSGYSTTNASVTVGGAVTDNVGLSQVSWSNSLGGSGSASVSGASINQSFNVALHTGSNVLTISARDLAGNIASKAITVTYTPATATATVQLAWDAPLAAANVVGYRVYYGTAPSRYSQSFGHGISAGNVTVYTVTGLNRGTRYFFAVTAVDSAGNESTYSSEVFRDLP